MGDDMEPFNAAVAGRLDEVAQILEEQGANPFRVRAYRRGAAVVRGLMQPVSELLRGGGVQSLEALAGIGPSLARSIREVALTGRLPMLERLRGASDPRSLLATVPGIGRRTAARLHDDLGIESLEELESAAHDGRLETIAGIGPKRLAGIRESLAERLGRVRAQDARAAPGPPVGEILDVDAEYRARAASGGLPRIAPRRFNPQRERWLPVLHTQRGARHYTALFSNTARAHRLGTTRDWVILYVEDEGGDRTYTAITARFGALAGCRVVAGREHECEELRETRAGARARRAP
jgi:Holliday junction resolvasome RuvABC DNA-binding subunit